MAIIKISQQNTEIVSGGTCNCMENGRIALTFHNILSAMQCAQICCINNGEEAWSLAINNRIIFNNQKCGPVWRERLINLIVSSNDFKDSGSKILFAPIK